MPLMQGFTRFRGEIMNGLEANILRSLTKRLRRQLQSGQDDRANQTFRAMMAFAKRYPQLERPIRDLFTEEINKMISLRHQQS